jgi:hypothetical protein
VAGFFVHCLTINTFDEILNPSNMKLINESDYEKASERADEIYGAKKGTPEEKELQELLKAIKDYEDDFIRMLKDNE